MTPDLLPPPGALMPSPETVTFRAGPHVRDDLDQLRIVHGLTATGAIKVGLSWLLGWWRDADPDEAAPAAPGQHLPHLTLAPPELLQFDHGPTDHQHRCPLPANDRWFAHILATHLGHPVEDLYRHAVCIARHLADAGQAGRL